MEVWKLTRETMDADEGKYGGRLWALGGTTMGRTSQTNDEKCGNQLLYGNYGRGGVRTVGWKKEGCAERIAPMSTLSQNGYGTYYTSDMGQARGRY